LALEEDTMHGPSDKLLTRRELVEFFNEHGFPIGESTLDKICMPSSGVEGPPVEAAWGGLFLYHPTKALRWAKARFNDPAALSRQRSANANSGRSRG
jgi:hypothetical protein